MHHPKEDFFFFPQLLFISGILKKYKVGFTFLSPYPLISGGIILGKQLQNVSDEEFCLFFEF